jgi:hypothetical protein
MNMLSGSSKFRPRAAAEYLRVATSTLAKMRARGDGPAFSKFGKRLIIYDRDELDRWLSELRNPGSA